MTITDQTTPGTQAQAAPAARAIDLGQDLRQGRRRRARPRRRQRRVRARRSSPPSWARRARASRRSCTAWPGSTRPTSGQTFVGDQEIGLLDDTGLTQMRRDRIGFVFQSFNLVPTLTAGENITLPADLAGTEGRPGLVRLPGRSSWASATASRHRPNEMSGGQQQRAACARALIGRPDLIFADEPTGNLDSNSSAEMLAFLRRSVDGIRPVDRHGHPRPPRRRLRRPGRVPRRRQGRGRAGLAHGRLGARAHEAAGQLTCGRSPSRACWPTSSAWCSPASPSCSGVTFISGTFVLTDTLHNTFTTLFGHIYQNIDFEVRGKAAFNSNSPAWRRRPQADPASR